MNATTESWRECFERALDADPSDQRVRCDLADHLDEFGDGDAEPLRWLARRFNFPLHYYVGRTPRFWYWIDLPRRISARLKALAWARDYEKRRDVWPTRRKAEAAFCRAYHAARAAGWNPDAP